MKKSVICRIISAALFLYFTISRLGETGSWIEALGAAFLFYLIWSLGKNSVYEPAPQESDNK